MTVCYYFIDSLVKDVCSIIGDNTNGTLVIVDGDNFVVSLEKMRGIEQNINLWVIIVFAIAGNKNDIYLKRVHRDITSENCSISQSYLLFQTPCHTKSATDVTIAQIVDRLHCHLNINIQFVLVSQDAFVITIKRNLDNEMRTTLYLRDLYSVIEYFLTCSFYKPNVAEERRKELASLCSTQPPQIQLTPQVPNVHQPLSTTMDNDNALIIYNKLWHKSSAEFARTYGTDSVKIDTWLSNAPIRDNNSLQQIYKAVHRMERDQLQSKSTSSVLPPPISSSTSFQLDVPVFSLQSQLNMRPDDQILKQRFLNYWNSSQSAFCKKYAIDRANFAKWLHRNKISNKSASAVWDWWLSTDNANANATANASVNTNSTDRK